MAAPSVHWFEVTGRDGPALQQFYARLFDWSVADAGDSSGYGLVSAAGTGIGGGIGASQDGGPGQVTFYVEVDDPASYLARAEQLGGRALVQPTEIPNYGLTFALFTDPEGHVVGLSKGIDRS
ncbi:MAG: glyoxalase [Chloroflexi bacterium]|nr:glyoxalase [Chloroflexota bacterium]